jgi:UDP-2,3-diacylglucosamine pyrophosphatase LpxH
VVVGGDVVDEIRGADRNLLMREYPSGLKSAPDAGSIRYYRSIWISDFHLGTRSCKADALLDFLRSHQAETLYLVGDIVDGWNSGRSWYWSPAQNAVVREIVNWGRRGTRVVFLPGNHDRLNLELVENLCCPVAIQPELVHRTADGRRMLVIHGDQFDASLSSVNSLSRMGGQAYTLALRINDWYTRERFKPDRSSLRAYLKRPFTKAVSYLTTTYFNEQKVVQMVRRHRADGVICGHSHRVEQRLLGPIWYINDGDWVDNCTALVEHHDGLLHLIRWALPETPAIQFNEPVPAAMAAEAWV